MSQRLGESSTALLTCSCALQLKQDGEGDVLEPREVHHVSRNVELQVSGEVAGGWLRHDCLWLKEETIQMIKSKCLSALRENPWNGYRWCTFSPLSTMSS